MEQDFQNIAYFVSFCIEQYKHKKGITGAEAIKTLEKYGVLDYLQDNFDILHTQSHQWILADIDEFINVRKQKI